MAVHPPADHRAADRAALYDQASAAFGTQSTTDMLSMIGIYQTVGGILNAFDTPRRPETSQAAVL